MIGLSLDKRILGYSEASKDPRDAQELVIEIEYISNEEREFYLTGPTTGAKILEAYCITHQEILDAGTVNPDAAFITSVILCRISSTL
ncbi:hypothetical protein [Paraflavitalea speifideaquila]|uniref:hypothetical protein n=1 Tax=Paraflavitalea speifideaquila TaxID=3076558 RepID=UPI0028E70FA5|nr:hypothetical protein [Paraflavitalea speifideiaquila]